MLFSINKYQLKKKKIKFAQFSEQTFENFYFYATKSYVTP